MPTGRIFDIKRFALNDGPGIRTTVFLKGCPLRCWWCHNPESQSRLMDFFWRGDRCLACEQCINACSTQTLRREVDGPVRHMDACISCGACAEACPSEALEAVGRELTVDDLLAEIEPDIPFFDESGGGVTFSGGEPLAQADFLIEALRACGVGEIHRAVDTCGYARPEVLSRVAALTDLFLFDLKHMDDIAHRRYTHVSNARILENLRLLARLDAALEIRVPLVPGINDAPQHAERLADFLTELRRPISVRLLPYHSMAQSKYRRLEVSYAIDNPEHSPSAEELEAFAFPLIRAGLKVGYSAGIVS